MSLSKLGIVNPVNNANYAVRLFNDVPNVKLVTPMKLFRRLCNIVCRNTEYKICYICNWANEMPTETPKISCRRFH